MIVHVYTQPACQPCRLTKKRLDDLGVEYLAFDIESDPSHREFIVDGLGAREAPVVVLFDDPEWHATGYSIDVIDYWTGYRPDKIAQLLDLKKENA